MPERVPYEYIAPITTDSRELLILTKLDNVYENKTKNEILDKLINILNKLNQEGAPSLILETKSAKKVCFSMIQLLQQKNVKITHLLIIMLRKP